MYFQDFAFIRPSSPIRSFVPRCIYANGRLDRPLILRLKPTGRAFFTNDFSTKRIETVYTINGVEDKRKERWRLAGQLSNQKVKFYSQKQLRMISCDLSPTTVYRLFHIDGASMAGKTEPLSQCTPQIESWARQCFICDETNTQSEHLDEIEKFFAELILNARKADDLVEHAIAQLNKHNGAISITNLCHIIGANHKTLDRHFNQIVGINPKFYAKILQLNWAIDLLQNPGNKTISQIANAAGFFDQSHFTKALKTFCNSSPNAFLQSNHTEITAFFADKNIHGPYMASLEDK